MVRAKLFVAASLATLASASAQPLGADKVFVGPDFGSGKPVVVDTIGGMETTFRALPSPGTKAKPSRWRMELSVLVHDPQLDDQDVLTAQLLKGKKKLGEPVVCEREGQLAADGKLSLAAYKLFYFVCRQKPSADSYEKEHETAGAHEIKLTLKRVLQGKAEQDFATLQVDVLELKQGAQNNPTRSWATDHDMKMPVSLVYEKPLNLILGGRLSKEAERGSFALHGASGAMPTGLVVTTWFKWADRPLRPTMSCFYKDQKIGLKPIDGLSGYEFDHWTFKGKDRETPKWDQVRFELSRGGIMMRKVEGQTPSYAQPPHWIAESPGEYRCAVVADGNVLKELFFTVADGKVVPPECQAGAFNTLHDVALLTTKTTSAGDGKWDPKPGARSGFEGRVAWKKGCPPTR